MGELEAAIALVFRKKGKATMSERDFVFAISLSFGWMSPKEAQKLLEAALDSDLLVAEGDLVKPNFDYKNMEIPKGYTPSPELLQKGAQPRGLFMRIVDEISLKAGIPAKEAISQANMIQDRMGIDIEVAALMVAKNLNIDFSDFLDTVEEEIGKRYKK